MNLNHGTPIGQVNNVPKSQSSFAAVNPPVNPLRAGVMPPEGTMLSSSEWLQVMQPVASTVNYPGKPLTKDQALETIDAVTNASRSPVLELPVCGIITIANSDWRPSSAIAIPPSITQGLGMELSAQFAIAHNQSAIGRQRHRWAVVTNRGTVLLLSGIRPEDRPLNPCAFPACVTANLTYDQAEAQARAANEPRLELAIVPRLWSVSLRRADCASDSHFDGKAVQA